MRNVVPPASTRSLSYAGFGVRSATLLVAVLFLAPSLFAERQWVEVRSPHFAIITDAGEKSGRDVALHFEQIRSIFGALFRRAKLQTGAPVRILAIRDAKAFRQIVPTWNGKAEKSIAGLFQEGPGPAYIAIDLSTRTDPQRWMTVYHEYAHLLLHANYSTLQPWFEEGFAEYVSTVKVDHGEMLVGAPPPSLGILSHSRLLPVTELFSAGFDSPTYNENNRRALFYAESWVAVDLLWFNRAYAGQTSHYLDFVRNHVPVEEAVQRAFGIAPAELDRQIQVAIRNDTWTVNHFSLPESIGAENTSTKIIDSLEVRAEMAALRVVRESDWEPAMAELEEILRQRPNETVALAALGTGWLRKGDAVKAADLFRSAIRRDPADWNLYLSAAYAMQQAGRDSEVTDLRELRQLLEKAAELNPESAEVQGGLGVVYSRLHDNHAAIAATRKALELRPDSETDALNLAGFYITEGQLEDAAPLVARLLSSSDAQVAQRAKTLESTLRRQKEKAEKTSVSVH